MNPRTGARGPVPTVTAEQIVEAAIAEGIGGFTLPAVARRIGLSHSGIYRYFADREALVNAALARIAAQIRWREAASDWQTLLRDYADALWEAFAEYPGSAEALLQATAFPPSMVAWQQAAVAELARFGVPTPTALTALDLIGDLVWIGVVGAERVADTVADGRTRAEHFEESWGAVGSGPEAAPGAARVAAVPAWHGQDFLHRKLDIVIAGIGSALSG